MKAGDDRFAVVRAEEFRIAVVGPRGRAYMRLEALGHDEIQRLADAVRDELAMRRAVHDIIGELGAAPTSATGARSQAGATEKETP